MIILYQLTFFNGLNLYYYMLIRVIIIKTFLIKLIFENENINNEKNYMLSFK